MTQGAPTSSIRLYSLTLTKPHFAASRPFGDDRSRKVKCPSRGRRSEVHLVQSAPIHRGVRNTLGSRILPNSGLSRSPMPRTLVAERAIGARSLCRAMHGGSRWEVDTRGKRPNSAQDPQVGPMGVPFDFARYTSRKQRAGRPAAPRQSPGKPHQRHDALAVVGPSSTCEWPLPPARLLRAGRGTSQRWKDRPEGNSCGPFHSADDPNSEHRERSGIGSASDVLSRRVRRLDNGLLQPLDREKLLTQRVGLEGAIRVRGAALDPGMTQEGRRLMESLLAAN